MRTLLLAVLCAALAACGQAPAGEASAAPPTGLTGEFSAASDAARTVTGDLSVERAGLIFDRGVVLYTRTLEPRRGGAEAEVELRRVVEQSLTGGAQSLCGAERPSFVALAAEAHASAVTLSVFAGDEPPGAMSSRLCGRFRYAASAGGRPRQGVVL